MPSGKRSRETRQKAVVQKPPSSRGSTSRARRLGGGVVVLIAVVLALVLALNGKGGVGPAGPEGPPLEAGADLAPAAAPAPGGSIDGIRCEPSEQVLFHIHARLTIYVNGRSRRVPYGIGISSPQAQGTPRGAFVTGGQCFAWLHTHAADGVIHIESPVQRTYTLGNFFDIWHQPLNRTRVGPAAGRVTAFVDGKVWTASPRTIPLDAHAQIQLDVGRPIVGPVRLSSWNGL